MSVSLSSLSTTIESAHSAVQGGDVSLRSSSAAGVGAGEEERHAKSSGQIGRSKSFSCIFFRVSSSVLTARSNSPGDNVSEEEEKNEVAISSTGKIGGIIEELLALMEEEGGEGGLKKRRMDCCVILSFFE